MISAVVVNGRPVPVEPSRDWVDYIGAFSGLIGAVLAAAAIGYALYQTGAAKRDLIRERRLEFELGLLAEMRRQMGVTQLQHLSGYVGALVRDSADETDLPVLRAAIGMRAGPEGTRLRDGLVGQLKAGSSEARALVLAATIEEVEAAISRRLDGGKHG